MDAGRSISRRASSSSLLTCSSQPPIAAASLRWWPLSRVPRTRETARADLKVSLVVDSTGNGALSMREPTAVFLPGSASRPPVSSTPEGAGKVGASADARVAATMSARSPGTMTKSPSTNWLRKLETFIAATLMPWMSRPRSSALMPSVSSLRASATSPTVGAFSSGISGST